MPPKAVPVETRVWRHVVVAAPDECWLWTGATNRGPNGRGGPYGKIGAGRKTLYPHRVIYMDKVGPIPEGYQVDHTCGESLCCNPAHLEAVSPWMNNARSTSATARNLRKDQCPQGHDYSPENTGYRKNTTWRYCRACAREAMAAKRQGLTYPEWLASR